MFVARCIKTVRFVCRFGKKCVFIINTIIMCRWFPEQKTNGTVSYIFVSSIANVFLCFFANLVMHLRDNTKVFSIRCANRMDRTEACLAAFVVSVQRNRFCTMGAFSRRKSPVKSFLQERYRTGKQNASRSGTLRREQAPALLYYSRHFP